MGGGGGGGQRWMEVWLLVDVAGFFVGSFRARGLERRVC
jgi:hypothetical protein